MTRESLLSENRKLKRRCPALFLMCNRTLGTTGPHFLVQLLRRDHSQVETALRPQRQHHPLPRLLPEEGWGHHALQVRLLPARSWLIKAPVSPDVHSTTANYIYVLFLSKQGWKCRPIRRRTQHRRWPEVEPNRGARSEGRLLRLSQNRDAAEEGGRRVWVPQDLRELPP